MSETEMKNICTNQLGMSEHQAEKSIEKATKIDKQIKSKMEERTVGRDGMSQSVQIERRSQDTFSVSLGGTSRTYNFNTINVADKIARNFNIPKENAQHIVDKAQKQGVLQNKIQNNLKKKQATPEAPKPQIKLNESKGLKR